MKILGKFLNNITMYRLMLYLLIAFSLIAATLGLFGILPYKASEIIFIAFYINLTAFLTNLLFSKIYKVDPNPESTPITALILSLIYGPQLPAATLLPLTTITFVAITSKYIIAMRRKHIFNPAAFGAVFGAVFLNYGASWWIGNLKLFPFVLFGGFLVLKKLDKWPMFLLFLFLTSLPTLAKNPQNGLLAIISSATIFFATVMLTEPQTSPTTKKHQTIFSLIISAFYLVITRFFPNVYYSLELTLLVGNFYTFFALGSQKIKLKLKNKDTLSPDTMGFWFEPDKNFSFIPGQFMEWTLPHNGLDSRGIRRYFTIASSPTEKLILLVSKFYDNPSSFKRILQKIKLGSEIYASDVRGSFILPKNKAKKLVFIAGGIGVTPFRSMIKFLVDKKEKRDIVLLYSNREKSEAVFEELFKEAEKHRVKTIYINTQKEGHINSDIIKKHISDWRERLFYLSGPQLMVSEIKKTLHKIGVKALNIKTDYFPGY